MIAVLRIGHVVCSEGCLVEMQYRSCWMNIGDMEYTRRSLAAPVKNKKIYMQEEEEEIKTQHKISSIMSDVTRGSEHIDSQRVLK